MNVKLTGLPSTQVYVYPGSHEDTTTEPIAVAAGYVGARGSASMNPSPNAATLLSTGYNIQNILSQGMVPNWQNLTQTQLQNRVRAMVFKSAVWGVPIGLFWHMYELSGDEVSNLLDDLKVAGATLKSDTQLVSLLAACHQVASTTFYACDTNGPAADFRPTPNSPVVDAGADLGSEFKYDIMGIDQTQFGAGWEIGAFAEVPSLAGGTRVSAP